MEPVARCFPSTESSTAAWPKEKSAKRVERSRRTGRSELNIQKLRDPQNLKPDMGAIGYLVGGLEPWNFTTFPSHWEFHHPNRPTSYLLLWIGGFSDFVD